jgi:pimeloyl-ACP methyl ester carboxylesterase
MRAIENRSRAKLMANLRNEAIIKREFVEDLPADLAERIDPTVIELGWRKINEPGIIDAMLDLHMDYGSNSEHYPKIQRYLRETSIPVLVLWGERDQYVSADGARAYADNQPSTEVTLLDGGHWLLETHPTEVSAAVRAFLE